MSLILSGTDGLSDVDGSAATPAIRGTDANTGIFFPAADTIAFSEGGVESMRIDSAGNVNIGQATSALQSGGTGITLYGSASSEIKFLNSTTGTSATDGIAIVAIGGNFAINNREAGAITFGTSNSERMKVDSAGNCGIGTSSPTLKLSVNGDIWQGNGAGTEIGRITNNSGWYDFAGNSSNVNGTQMSHGSTVRFLTASTERMRIDSSGNVGIGISSPSQRLHVNGRAIVDNGTGSQNGFSVGTTSSGTGTNFGSIDVNGTSFSGMYLRVGNTINAQWISNQGVLVDFGTVTNIPLLFKTNDTERMRIDSSGNLLVGTTTAAPSVGFSGTPRQTVSSSVCVTDGTNRIALNGQENGSTIFPGLFFNSSAMRVYNGSNTGVFLSSGSTSWTSTSDERVKDIIEPISDAANKVSTIRAVIGKYKTDEQNVRRAFLIAQDVQAVLPEAVSEGDGGYLGVQYTDTIPLLVAAIQELKAELDSVKAELQTLKGN